MIVPIMHIQINMKGQWGVRRQGTSRMYRVFKSENEAIRFGKRWSGYWNCPLFIHMKDGSVRSRIG